MKRRDFLSAASLLSLFASAPAWAKAKRKKSGSKSRGRNGGTDSGSTSRRKAGVQPPPPTPGPRPSDWRNYEITTAVAIRRPSGRLRLWLPLPLYRDTVWQKSLDIDWQGNFETARIYRDPVADMEVFYAEWREGVSMAQARLVTGVATQDRLFDITQRGQPSEREDVLQRCLQGTAQLPIDGPARETAVRIVGRIENPLAQAKAIYEWVVDNAIYDAGNENFGRGNVRALFDSGRYLGRSSEINGLFVALARSMGIPARLVSGIRVDASELAPGLGGGSVASRSQHCRAEFFTPFYGWVPVDPADVVKAMADEPGSPTHPKIAALRKRLFGYWEMNWVALNTAQDIALRQSSGPRLALFAHPQAETADGRLNCSDPESFSYTISARRLGT